VIIYTYDLSPHNSAIATNLTTHTYIHTYIHTQHDEGLDKIAKRMFDGKTDGAKSKETRCVYARMCMHA
jgi:hypothetical protein